MKRWFIEGLSSSLRKKKKVVPPSSYEEAYKRAIDIESQKKTTRDKRKLSDTSGSDTSRESPTI